MLGIICAMHAELEGLRTALDLEVLNNTAPWPIYKAKGRDILAMVCGGGKVNAAAGLTYFLAQHPLQAVIGVGVAGAIAPDLRLGDVLISSGAIQHDIDVSAFGYEVGMVPGLRKKTFGADRELVARALAAGGILENITAREGLILSGDKFVAGNEANKLKELFQGDCVDMETAAWAQVCMLFKVPWVALRSVSDKADGHAPQIFKEFLNLAVGNMSAVILEMLKSK